MEYWCTLYNGSVLFSTKEGREVLKVQGDEDITSPTHITTFCTSSPTQTLSTLTSSTLSVHSLPYHPPPVPPLNSLPSTLRKFATINHNLIQPRNLISNASGELLALHSTSKVSVYSFKHCLPQTTCFNNLIPCYNEQPPTSKLRLTHSFPLSNCLNISFSVDKLGMSFMNCFVLADLERKINDPGVITSLKEVDNGFIMCNDSVWKYGEGGWKGGERKLTTCCTVGGKGEVWTGGKDRCLTGEEGRRYEGHTETVLGVEAGTVSGVEYVVSLADDKTVKLWSGRKGKEGMVCHLTMRVEGNKGGTCLGISRNGKYLGVGGGDKIATVYNVVAGKELKKVCRLKGHKRSINDVTFSPVDRLCMTCGGEGLVKVWNLTGECVRTFQGHAGTVVKGVFTKDGGRVWTGDGGGILKCWSVKSSMCIGTIVAHEAPVWGMCWIGEDLITGGGDGKVIKWKDNSEETRMEAERLKDEEDLKNQELMNCLYKGEYLSAVRIALKMDKPRTCLQALEKAHAGSSLANVFNSLTDDEARRALSYSREWNTRSRNCLIGNLLFTHAVDRYGVEGLVDLGVEKLVHAMIGYNERHLTRFDGLIEGGYVVEHVLEQMNVLEGEGGEDVYGLTEDKVDQEVFEKVEGRVVVEEGTWVDGVLEIGSDGEGDGEMEVEDEAE
ncbi:hypothetical protein TrST_g9865 [Triparma strigata]|uniref:U3 small nucleolar RNA-associated protein 13 C-terminal domain-containing protein n=1 Tax=Triparma strigata TaxID=1606541 RepID=A0A9W7EB75_9STRA|nr:hypothetical protein TrST_g9865 [Triparma strigata]